MSTERGMNIQDAVDDMERAERLRKNEEFRNMKFQQQKKKKEADATAIATTSDGFTDQKPLNNYTKESEECQDVKSDTPGDTSGREIRQQRCAELPVYLL